MNIFYYFIHKNLICLVGQKSKNVFRLLIAFSYSSSTASTLIADADETIYSDPPMYCGISSASAMRVLVVAD